jgi:NAD(P)H-hydrate epimerase
MNILTATQIREADRYTMQQEPISSWNLMERTSGLFLNQVLKDAPGFTRFRILCGAGNNGGDGLAVGRMLLERGFSDTKCYLLKQPMYSPDNLLNQKLLQAFRPDALQVFEDCLCLPIEEDVLWIDALLGTGLNRPPEGLLAACISWLSRRRDLISIDMPSGLYADGITTHDFVRGSKTFTFEAPKEGLLMPQHEVDFDVVPIGLNKAVFEFGEDRPIWYQKSDIRKLVSKRKRHSHKGTFGHLLVVAGSKSKSGAAVMTAKAALRSGVGLVTILLPEEIRETVMAQVPEAMCMIGGHDIISELPDFLPGNVDAIVAGPGLGTDERTGRALNELMQIFPDVPLLLDADAINLLSNQRINIKFLNNRALFTPHPGEFKRLVGPWKDDQERLALLSSFCLKECCSLILKDTYSVYSNCKGHLSYHTGGNTGLAKGGSGDVLTGIVGGLLASGYQRNIAAALGLYLHGCAADIARSRETDSGMTALSVVNCLPEAWEYLC